MWGGDWINLVWVGVGIKKARGVVGSGKMLVGYYFNGPEGSRTRA